MKRHIALFLVIAIFFTSCTNMRKVTEKVRHEKTPEYTLDKDVKTNLVDATTLAHPTDTTKSFVVYNVVEQESKNKISDETVRSFVHEFFGTLVTIFTLYRLEQP